MKATFYHIMIIPREGVSLEKVLQTMNLAIDWFKYTEYNWIVYTSSNAKKWQERLKPLVAPNGFLFICRFDVNDRQGWMLKSFWDWLKKER